MLARGVPPVVQVPELGALIARVPLAELVAQRDDAFLRACLVLVAAAATLWLVNALVIDALYAFRTADIARLATWFLGRTPLATLGNIGVLLIAAVVTAYGTEAMTALLATVFGMLLLGSSSKMIALVRKDFIAA